MKLHLTLIAFIVTSVNASHVHRDVDQKRDAIEKKRVMEMGGQTRPKSAYRNVDQSKRLNKEVRALQSSRRSPSRRPTSRASNSQYTKFYAIADVPYNSRELAALPGQIAALPSDAEFLIHLGDIRNAVNGDACRTYQFEQTAAILRKSRVPVFIVVGDNEWNDCPNIDAAYARWHNAFGYFEDNWNHSFNVYRQSKRPENFAFVHKKTLFIGLNIVGGRVHDEDEWSSRLSENAQWTTSMFEYYTKSDIKTVAIFAHAEPQDIHNEFFYPIRNYVKRYLPSSVNVLYMNGDAHEWAYDSAFMGLNNFMRIQLTGGTSEPPLKMIVDPSANSVQSAFRYNRGL